MAFIFCLRGDDNPGSTFYSGASQSGLYANRKNNETLTSFF